LQFGEAAETGLAKQALLEEGLALVTSARGPRTPKRIALRALARYPLILPGSEHGLRRIIDDACAPLGLKLEVVAEIDSLTSVKRSVEAGLASTILPLGSIAEETDQGRLRASIIDSPSMLRRVVCATNVTRPATAAGAAVMALMRDVIRERVAEGTWPARWIAGPAERVARATNG
jgi:LysR family nitrogen assimilation transcriptional regulator